jgi:hypothetical protein
MIRLLPLLSAIPLLAANLAAAEPAAEARIGGIDGCTRLALEAGGALPFGCATAANLAAMLDDPTDLERPRPLDPPVGDAATRAILQHRAGTPAPFPADTGTGAPQETSDR